MAKKMEFTDSETKKANKKVDESIELPTKEEEEVKDSDVQDIDLSVTRKKKFRIDGDNNRMLELNISDLNIIVRLKETYPKLQELSEKAANEWEDTDDEGIDGEGATKTVELLKSIDGEMRNLVDYIFDSNVSEVCAPDGSMFDPFNGRLRFDHIIEVLSGLYEENLESEVKKLTRNVQKHTSKYIK